MRGFLRQKAPQDNPQSHGAMAGNDRCRQPQNGGLAAQASAAFFPASAVKKLKTVGPDGERILPAGVPHC